MNTNKIRTSSLISACVLGLAGTAAMDQALAESYTAVELAPGALASSATTISSGNAAGFATEAAYTGSTHAALWNGTAMVDLHPAFLADATNQVKGRSTVQGSAQNVQVGWGIGPGSNNRNVPLAWYGNAESATALTIPFANAGGQALATDGSQIVGYGIPLVKDGTATGPARALLWDATSGVASDLGANAQLLGVSGGQQVGYVLKSLQNAALWNGSANSMVSLHPKNAVVSVAYGTDGFTQVGYSGFDVRVRAEANKGNKDKRFNYAYVWNGSASSAVNIHAGGFTHTYATAIKGQWIAGYGADETRLGTPAYYHAIVWDAAYQATDLNAALPAPYVGSQALAVDELGNVAGYAMTATGYRQAVVWMRNP